MSISGRMTILWSIWIARCTPVPVVFLDVPTIDSLDKHSDCPLTAYQRIQTPPPLSPFNPYTPNIPYPRSLAATRPKAGPRAHFLLLS
ncbi:hypothetical protein HOY82DRAFT_173253 [Tuber indicum]|nr:hypothetical protein HOY82DRAFT_173253 [Tuber indicum]